MKNLNLLVGPCCLLVASYSLVGQQQVSAQPCNYFAGTASTGQSINVDLCSISQASTQSVDFTYYLGNERITSQANCEGGFWTTFPEKQVHRPQSDATQNMLDVVCSYRSSDSDRSSNAETATVFDPPSNVRVSPNGEILCSVGSVRQINIYGSTGSWYYTDACGEIGVIDASQIRF